MWVEGASVRCGVGGCEVCVCESVCVCVEWECRNMCEEYVCGRMCVYLKMPGVVEIRQTMWQLDFDWFIQYSIRRTNQNAR